ncbi:MAG TPA: urease accessory protein [Flavilitoribacter sp.]|nr:urease accessory protein [Flavilitoribacter sp.]
METTFPLLFAAVVGFGHAFEADHLVAVSNIVTKRDKLNLALKDGIFWGLGHTSMIFLIGLVVILGKVAVDETVFAWFEALVGCMLIGLGGFRLFQFFRHRRLHRQHIRHEHHPLMDHHHNHHLAYGVGLIHGLAGSGAMILLVMTEIRGSFNSLLYLVIFGVGSIAGMLVAAGIFSLPFSRKLQGKHGLQSGLILLSSVLCIGYGAFVLAANLS